MVSAKPSAWQKTRKLIACQGIGGVIEEFVARVRYRLSGSRQTVPYHEFRASDWDRNRGVETGGIVQVDALDPDLPNRVHAEAYVPSDVRSIGAHIGALLDLGVRPAEFTLLDLGCGKGRVILMGAEAAFQTVIGVEFDPELARCAVENLRHYRSRRRTAMSVHCADAADFPIPPGPLVIWLFNPFRGPVLEAVAANVRKAFSQDPRAIYLLYAFPPPDSRFRGDPMFRLVESAPRREIYRVVANGTD